MSNNYKHRFCRFAEQTVSYLYGEFTENEKTEFEAHLKNCPACLDEIRGFEFVRASVLEWRGEDFLKIAAATFEIPSSNNEKFAPGFSSQSPSLADKLRRLFSFNPAFAAAALAFLVVCGGIIFFALNFSGGKEIANRGDEKNAVKIAAAPTIEVTEKSEERNVADKAIVKPAPRSPETVSVPEKREGQSAPVKSAVKVSAAVPKNNSNNLIDNVKETKDKKTPVNKKQQVPNLNDYGDDADETIRLADLFAELDTK